MADRISSRANPLIKRLRRLGAAAEARREEGAFIAEGVRIIEEALGARAAVETAIVSPRLTVTERGRALQGRLRRAKIQVLETSDSILDSVADAQTSQGVLALVRTPKRPDIGALPPDRPFWVVGWGLQDPGNIGTLIRSADAAGADLFVTVAGTSDPRSPKSVRASAGSVFRIPIAHGLSPEEILDAAASRGLTLFGTDPDRGLPYHAQDYAGAVGFVFGREGEGLPSAVEDRLAETVTIPMRPGVSSLNVAAAAAIVLFEAARQRAGGVTAVGPGGVAR